MPRPRGSPVVKPLANLTRTAKALVQPGLKVRGRKYHQRSLAGREYALGVESLERLARAEPLWRVHEPVFAVLAMESEPVDPRL